MKPLEPVVHTLALPLRSADAFELFTSGIARWWPFKDYSCSGADAVDVRFEPKAGGAVEEVSRSGERHAWGCVTRWDPPHSLSMTWHPDQPAERATRLSVEFRDTGSGCTLTLVHDGWSVRGDEAAKVRDGYRAGWALVLSRMLEHARARAPEGE